MRCAESISHLVPSLSLTDAGSKALQMMEEYHLTALPVVVEGRCIGLAMEDSILDWEDAGLSFAEVDIPLLQANISSTAHIYEALKLLSQRELTVVPVHNEQMAYLGCITSETLLTYVANGLQTAEQGGTIVLEVKQQNYSLSEIARICESEQVTILSTMVHNVPESDKLWVTVKTNKLNLDSVAATFERMNYTIVELHAVSDNSDTLENNYNALLHYMNI
jgi:acetoin utilization protein AcuB